MVRSRVLCGALLLALGACADYPGASGSVGPESPRALVAPPRDRSPLIEEIDETGRAWPVPTDSAALAALEGTLVSATAAPVLPPSQLEALLASPWLRERPHLGVLVSASRARSSSEARALLRQLPIRVSRRTVQTAQGVAHERTYLLEQRAFLRVTTEPPKVTGASRAPVRTVRVAGGRLGFEPVAPTHPGALTSQDLEEMVVQIAAVQVILQDLRAEVAVTQARLTAGLDASSGCSRWVTHYRSSGIARVTPIVGEDCLEKVAGAVAAAAGTYFSAGSIKTAIAGAFAEAVTTGATWAAITTVCSTVLACSLGVATCYLLWKAYQCYSHPTIGPAAPEATLRRAAAGGGLRPRVLWSVARWSA
jgi:hypothetical protein